MPNYASVPATQSPTAKSFPATALVYSGIVKFPSFCLLDIHSNIARLFMKFVCWRSLAKIERIIVYTKVHTDTSPIACCIATTG